MNGVAGHAADPTGSGLCVVLLVMPDLWPVVHGTVWVSPDRSLTLRMWQVAPEVGQDPARSVLARVVRALTGGPQEPREPEAIGWGARTVIEAVFSGSTCSPEAARVCVDAAVSFHRRLAAAVPGPVDELTPAGVHRLAWCLRHDSVDGPGSRPVDVGPVNLD